MAPDDLDPISKLRLGKAAQWVALAVVLVGLIGGVLVALTPTDGAEGAMRQNVLFALACCLGPSVFAAIPLFIVGRMIRRSARQSDVGSLYRGWD
jgi:uncharacterized membrane protein YhdT